MSATGNRAVSEVLNVLMQMLEVDSVNGNNEGNQMRKDLLMNLGAITPWPKHFETYETTATTLQVHTTLST